MPVTTQTTQTAPITAEHTTVPVNESEIIESERISQEISRFEEMIITSESAAVETIQESAAANSDSNIYLSVNHSNSSNRIRENYI